MKWQQQAGEAEENQRIQAAREWLSGTEARRAVSRNKESVQMGGQLLFLAATLTVDLQHCHEGLQRARRGGTRLGQGSGGAWAANDCPWEQAVGTCWASSSEAGQRPAVGHSPAAGAHLLRHVHLAQRLHSLLACCLQEEMSGQDSAPAVRQAAVPLLVLLACATSMHDLPPKAA